MVSAGADVHVWYVLSLSGLIRHSVPLRVNPGGPQIKGARTLGRRNEELEAEIPDWHAEPSCGRRATSPILKLVFGEQAENIDRKDFTIEERVAIGGEIEPKSVSWRM
jgi:hypothetical protein